MHYSPAVEPDRPIFLRRSRFYEVPSHNDLMHAIGGSVTLLISGNLLYQSPEMRQAVELKTLEFQVATVIYDGGYHRAIGRIRLLPADIWLHSEIVYTNDPSVDGVVHLLWSRL